MIDSILELDFKSCEMLAGNLEFNMANVKKGNLTSPPQWWKHLRDWKRVFWKSERMAQKRSIKNEKD